MLGMWKNILNKERYAYDIFIKAFERINHHLMIALLVVYGFPWDVLRYMGNFFVDRLQRVCGIHNYQKSIQLNIRTIVIQHLHRRSVSIYLKFTFKQLC